MTANRVETEFLIFGDRKSSECDGRLRFYLRRGLRYGDVSGMADLAMLFVRGVPVPVPGSLHGKEAHGKNQGHRQQSREDSFRHRWESTTLCGASHATTFKEVRELTQKN
jgi:hypothetical protein